jgi:hypothetical protein
MPVRSTSPDIRRARRKILDRLARKIIAAACLEEAIFWHKATVEQLWLEILELSIGHQKTGVDRVRLLREQLTLHVETIKRLETLVARGDQLSLPEGNANGPHSRFRDVCKWLCESPTGSRCVLAGRCCRRGTS